jgi:N-acetylmuramoyl-L-alanine amidase
VGDEELARRLAISPLVLPEDLMPPTNTWVSLDTWAETNGFNRPQLLPGPELTYRIERGEERLQVTIGSRVASWNGIEHWLGYAPQLMDNRPAINALDIRGNLGPLARPLETFDRNLVIVLDPGHGGSDTGTRNILNNQFEKEYALDWAMRLARLLREDGHTVHLTRTNDIEVSLTNRVAFADAREADLFLSLHFNSAFPSQTQSGLETYCLTPAGMASHLTRGYEDDPGRVFPNNAFDEMNVRYAAVIHRRLLEATLAADRGVRRARFMAVLRGQNRPAVLIEGGFLSNPAESRLIQTEAYRENLARAVAASVQSFARGPASERENRAQSDPVETPTSTAEATPRTRSGTSPFEF